MGKKIGVGGENFGEFIRDNNYYVDKTELIYDLVEKSHNKVTLFTRPRRFGKTLTMSMLESFFDISRKSRDIFQGLDILKHEAFCAEWMNQYPVIFLSLKDVEGRGYDAALEMLKEEISKLCIRYAFLGEQEVIDPADAASFRKLKFKEGSIGEVKNALQTIMRLMATAYGKPTILLMDEYDVPLAKAHANGYYQEMLQLIRSFMQISLKGNDFLKFAVVTGCLRISKESIFTGVNNFACYSVMNRKFSRYFGFSETEVAEMLASSNLSNRLGILRDWYDGYLFGNSQVYCPWDVVRYISNAMDEEGEGKGEVEGKAENEEEEIEGEGVEGEEPENFWANTSENSILDEFLNRPDLDPSDKFEKLLNGGCIEEDISQELTYDHYADTEKGLWSILLMTGYVSKADKAASLKRAKLKIPNKEIAELFRDVVVDRFNKTLDSSMVTRCIAALWKGDEQEASDTLSDILWDSISYYDYAENYYHGILNGLMTSRGYKPDDNVESGMGRLDVRFKDKPNRRCLLFECKRSKKERDLDKDCEAAIQQIIAKGYNRTLPEGYREQLCYGVAFFGKTAKVKLLKS